MSNNGFIYFDGVGIGKGGLCDRLKGMYSCWILSKKLDKNFYFNIPSPVSLKVKNFKNNISNEFEELYIIDWDNFYNYKEQIKSLNFPEKNYKIHTNIDFSELLNSTYSFSDFINCNFDWKNFEKDKNIEVFDIGIHVRCGGKMVKWNDYDFEHVFDLEKFKQILKSICDENKNIFICSDSIVVLEQIESLNLKNITISPYEPKHIDRGPNVDDNDYISTLYDLLTLANCKKIYYTYGEFAKTASRIYGNEIQPFYT
jgi:hypothetical protein